MGGATLFDKIWNAHVVLQETGAPPVLYIDLHLTHEVTSPQAFQELRRRGLKIWNPDRNKATTDHCNPTRLGPDGSEHGALIYADEQAKSQILQQEANCAEFGINLCGLDHPSRGVIHVFGPDLGLTQPGMTIVCGDSHTATHGAFGAVAFGIGTSEVGHVMATQCLLQRKPKTMKIAYQGTLPEGVSAKDLALFTIAAIGVNGGTGYAIEFCGEAVRTLSMEGRMTLCNMAIEAGARTGMVSPDETTFAYLKGRLYAPAGEAWERAVAEWRKLPSDPDAEYDRVVEISLAEIAPMVTYGINPAMAIRVDGKIPDSAAAAAPGAKDEAAFRKALTYMGVEAGRGLGDYPVDSVFIGSCTNGRLEDLRAAAEILRGRKVAAGVDTIVVPGSGAVKRAAEALGLDRIFTDAGAEWREPGCSLCLAMNGDFVASGKRCVSTSNRNFEGRQGPGARTILASPATAAASAVCGHVADPRALMGGKS